MTTKMRVASFGAMMRDAVNAKLRWLCALIGSVYTTAIVTLPTLCGGVNTNVNMDTLFNGMVEIIVKIALYVGLLITVGGVFSLVMAYKDDNADGQSRAVRLIVIGIVLVGFRTILGLTGIV